MTWKKHIREFEIYLKLERSFSSNTSESYLRDIRKFQEYLNISSSKEQVPENISPENISSFLAYLGTLEVAPSTQSRILSGIKAFYRFLHLNNLISADPTFLISSPKINRKLPDTLAFHEIEKLLSAIDLSKPEGARNRAILETLYSSGLRVSELTNLRLSNLYFDIGFLKIIGKGNKERFVPIGRDAIKFISIYLESIRPKVKIKKGNEDIVFLNRRGAALTRVMIFTIIKQLAETIGLQKNISPHTLRHSFATELIQRGADLRAVQDMLGHESITTTEIYTHLDRDYLRSNIIQFHPRS